MKQDESGKWHMGAGGHEISYSETPNLDKKM